MVGDDQLYAAFGGQLGFLDRGDAAVNRDDGMGSLGRKFLDRRDVETVSFFEPVGHIVSHLGLGLSEQLKQNSHAGDAIHVVVAVEHDTPAISNRPGQ